MKRGNGFSQIFFPHVSMISTVNTHFFPNSFSMDGRDFNVPSCNMRGLTIGMIWF